jgi:anti-sigma B factor antagonist
VALQVAREDAEGVAVVAVHGELDIENAAALKQALVEAIGEHRGRRIVVDLEGLEFIDSVGLGILIGGLKRARSSDGDLVLVATGRNVLRVLELTGLVRVFEIHPGRREALGEGPFTSPAA